MRRDYYTFQDITLLNKDDSNKAHFMIQFRIEEERLEWIEKGPDDILYSSFRGLGDRQLIYYWFFTTPYYMNEHLIRREL